MPLQLGIDMPNVPVSGSSWLVPGSDVNLLQMFAYNAIRVTHRELHLTRCRA